MSAFPYLFKRRITSRHEPMVELSAPSNLIKMDPAFCFMAIRRARAKGIHGQPEACQHAANTLNPTPRELNCLSAERMAANLASTHKIDHAVNNPLRILKNNLKVMVKKTDGNPWGIDDIRKVIEAINRFAKLINTLMSPSKKVAKRQCAELNHLGALHGEPSPHIDL